MSNIRLFAIVLLVTAAAACKIDPLPPKVDAATSTDGAGKMDANALADADVATAHPDASLDLQADSPRDQLETPPYPDAVGLDARTPDSGTGPDSPVAPVDVPSVLPDSPAVSVDAPSADRTPDVAVAPVDVSSEAGPACTTTCDDGLSCTTDTCVAGTCQSTTKLGYCVIEKACYTDGDTKPTDTCQACSITVSTSAWSAQPEGAKCGTSKSCQSGTCAACGDVGQACCGASLGTCTAGAACNSGTSKCVADKAIDISGGGNTTFCALFQSGRVRCWGSSGPMLGIGTNTASSGVAPPASGLQDAVQISVGYHGVCAVRATGSVVCWGDPVNSGASTNVSVVVSGITNATQVSVGGSHACVRTADSKILCWGQNGSGQFGDGTQNGNSSPTPMLDVADGRIVAASCDSTCVLRAGGQVSCTGHASGNGLAASVSVATNLPTVSAASSLSGNGSSCSLCAVVGTGGLSCWGGVLGGIQTAGTVAGAGQVLAAVLDNGSIWAIQQDHSLWALGSNTYGQLGDGTLASTTTYHTTPRLAHVSAPLGGVVAMAVRGIAFYGSSCLLRDNGSVSCAGSAGPTLGDGQSQPMANRTPFVPVVGILPVASEDGQCFDGVDNDGNGKTDLDDPACAQDLGSATGTAVATVPFTGIFGNYLQESCNTKSGTGNFGGPEAVLVWTAPSGGTYQFDTNGSSFDTVLAAFKGNPQTTAELACNDNGAGLSGNASAIQVQVITGDKLTLVVDSKAAPTSTASFTLNITKQ